MFNKFKRAFKRGLVRYIRYKQTHASFQVAKMVRHEYPKDLSLHDIVREMKRKQNAKSN